jgi:hypothetical protein
MYSYVRETINKIQLVILKADDKSAFFLSSMLHSGNLASLTLQHGKIQ